ncbi:MAG: porin [Alphaproteobacteria bacterium]|nr:porin [Alphaproteobacteria bacterium]
MLKSNSFIISGAFAVILSQGSFANAPKSESSAKAENSDRLTKLEQRAVYSDKSSIKIEGSVNRAIQWADNGVRSNLSHISPAHMTSNLQITGTHKLGDDLKIKPVFAIEFGSNLASGRTSDTTVVDVGVSQSNAFASNSLSIRNAEIIAESETYGSLFMGRGYMGSTGVIYYTDLSGTSVCLHPYTTIGGISFRNKATGRPYNENIFSPGSTLKPGGLVFEDGDGVSLASKSDRIRYDTPKFYGFNASFSHAFQNKGNLYDASLKFAAILAKIVVVAQTSWSKNKSEDIVNGLNYSQNLGQTNVLAMKGPRFKTVNGALGLLFPVSFSGKEWTGINTHISGARRNWKMRNQVTGTAIQGKLGFTDEFTALGHTSFVVSTGRWKAMDIDFWTNVPTFIPGSAGTGGPIHMVGYNWGTGVVQNFDAVGTQAYLRYDNFKLKRKGTTDRFHAVNIVYAGLKVNL